MNIGCFINFIILTLEILIKFKNYLINFDFFIDNKIQIILQSYKIMLQEQISSNQINQKEKPKIKLKANSVELGQKAINELQLNVNMDDREDVQQLSRILIEVLNYPNDDLADLHSQAMRLGNYDLEKISDSVSKHKNGKRQETLSSFASDKQTEHKQFCSCCGFVKQQYPLKICTSFDEVKNMGVSTYLYFSMYKNLAILLLIMTIIYSAFSLITNVIASRNINDLTMTNTKVDYITISLSAKQTHDTPQNRRNYFISCWLGLVTMVCWLFALIIIKFYQKKSINQYDNDTISCPDYSIVIEGLPLDVKKQQLQDQLNAYYEFITNNKSIPIKWKQPIIINKINIGKPFYLNQQSFNDSQLDNINKQVEVAKQNIIKIILHRQQNKSYNMSKQERQNLCQKYQTLNKQKMEKHMQIAQKIKLKFKEKSKDQTTTAFVVFQKNISSSLMAFLHDKSLFGRLKSLCGSNQEYFSLKRQNRSYELNIKRAPEPEDIIWTNIGLQDCSIYLKKLLTFSVTLILLGICFGIVYGLTKLQTQAGENRYISIAISLTISIVNVALGQVIRVLTVAEKDYTQTYRQSSLAIKSILAQMVNTIIIPVITAYQIKKNVYQTNGLVDTIFVLSISNAIVTPLVLFINPELLFRKLIKCVYSSPSKKLNQTQKQFNGLYQGIVFEVGYQSIYSVTLFMFACFFVSLQPIVTVIAMFGYFLKYWIQKYTLFNRYKRPVPGTSFVSDSVYKFVRIGPLVYSFGSLTWSNLSPNGIPPEALFPNLLCLGFSVIIILFPIDSLIIGLCFDEQVQKLSLFEQNRIFLPSQYDRLNPATSQQGIEDYRIYLQKTKSELKNLSQQKRQQIAKKMMFNLQRGQMNHMNNRHAFGNIPNFNPVQPPNFFAGFMGMNLMANPMQPINQPPNTFAPNYSILPQSMMNQAPLIQPPPPMMTGQINQMNRGFAPNNFNPSNIIRSNNNINSVMNNQALNPMMINPNIGYNNNPLNMIMPGSNNNLNGFLNQQGSRAW